MGPGTSLRIVNLQYCAKVMQTYFAEIRDFSWLFDDTADSDSKDFTETTPLISIPKHRKNLIHVTQEDNSKEGKECHCTETKGSHYYLEKMPTSGYDFASETMDAVSLTNLQ